MGPSDDPTDEDVSVKPRQMETVRSGAHHVLHATAHTGDEDNTTGRSEAAHLPSGSLGGVENTVAVHCYDLALCVWAIEYTRAKGACTYRLMDRGRRVETVDVLLVNAGSGDANVEPAFLVADLLAHLPHVLLLIIMSTSSEEQRATLKERQTCLVTSTLMYSNRAAPPVPFMRPVKSLAFCQCSPGLFGKSAQ